MVKRKRGGRKTKKEVPEGAGGDHEKEERWEQNMEEGKQICLMQMTMKHEQYAFAKNMHHILSAVSKKYGAQHRCNMTTPKHASYT